MCCSSALYSATKAVACRTKSKKVWKSFVRAGAKKKLREQAVRKMILRLAICAADATPTNDTNCFWCQVTVVVFDQKPESACHRLPCGMFSFRFQSVLHSSFRRSGVFHVPTILCWPRLRPHI